MRYLLWDFDGTIANRKNMWSGALYDALIDIGVSCDREDIRPHLRSGFPWHEPNVEHYELDIATSTLG
jgi:putative hydrolase of the HAD superfamily